MFDSPDAMTPEWASGLTAISAVSALTSVPSATNLAGVREAHRARDQAEATLAIQRQQALADTANAYWNLAYLQRVVVISEQAHAVAQEEKRIVYARVDAGTASLDARERTKLNALLQGLEQALTDPQGLPGREWYRHLIYAPGLLTGYGVKTLPGVREAAEDDRWDEANRYVGITAAALAAYCDRLDEATALLN